MARRFGYITLIVTVLAGLILGLAWLNAKLMSSVPAAKQVQAQETFRPFLIETTQIEGLFGNLDVDSAVFRYTTATNEAEFWRRVEQNIVDSKWVPITADGEIRRYQRIIPPVGQRRFWSVEELRIRFRQSDRTVVVGWVQADPDHVVLSLAECSENSFAERWVWPLVQGE